MDSEGYLPVQLIASFHRVKSMTEDFNVVVAAIQSSDKLEITPDLGYVRTLNNPTKWPILDSVVSLSISLTAMKIPQTATMLPSPASSSSNADDVAVTATELDSTTSSRRTRTATTNNDNNSPIIPLSSPAAAAASNGIIPVVTANGPDVVVASSAGGLVALEMFNPNVPEFVPKSKLMY